MAGYAEPAEDCVEVHELKYFLALSETLNFTRAAEHCNVSQPALTRAIRSLEDKLGGGPLIHRERGNTHLTELGLMLKPHFEHVLAELDGARNRARDYCKLAGSTLTIGLMCTIGPQRLVDFLAGFASRYPKVTIHLEDGSADRIEQQLLAGALDVALLARPGDLEDRLHGIPLFRERFVVALPPGDRLSQSNAVRMRDLNRYCYLGRANCEYHDYLREARTKLGGIEFERPYTSDRDDWVQSMVMAGLGFTFIPEYAVTMPQIATRPLIEPEVWRTVQFVTVRGRPHSPAVGAFVRAAREQAWEGKVSACAP